MAELLVITLVILFALTLVILIRGEGGRLAVYPNIHLYKRQHCSWLPFRLLTGNDVTGPPLSSPLFSGVVHS